MADRRGRLRGKLVAGGAGLLLGGPLGALAGLVAGHAYDRWRRERTQPGAPRRAGDAGAGPKGFEAYARQVAGLFRRDPAVLEQLLGGLFEVARADGRVNEAELRFLREVGRIFGFSDAAFAAIRARYEAAGRADGGDDPYAVLGLSRRADALAIKRAYRELVREHHPDRLVASGMPEELVAQANRRLAAINAAYDRIAKDRGLR